jgi:hypothetical protein
MNRRVRRVSVVGKISVGHLYSMRMQCQSSFPSRRPDRSDQRVSGPGLRLSRLRRWGPRLATDADRVQATVVCDTAQWAFYRRRQEKVE